MINVPDDILKRIEETETAEAWEPITSIRWTKGEPWRLMLFDHYVGDDFDTVTLVRLDHFDPNNGDLLSSEYIFGEMN